MSCDWDLYCVDCQTGCGFEWNHGEESLSALWSVRKEYVAFHDAMPDFELRLYCGIQPDFIPFLRKHSDHNVKLQDEYGRFDMQCHGWAKCPSCDSSKACVLPVDHDGECESK